MSDNILTYKTTSYRFVAVLNKKCEPGRVMNVLGHIAAGMVNLHRSDLQHWILLNTQMLTVAFTLVFPIIRLLY